MTIADFFLKLAKEGTWLQLSSEEREEAIRTADLGDEQRELLLSGSLGEIRVNIEVDFKVGDEIVTFVTASITVYCPPPADA